MRYFILGTAIATMTLGALATVAKADQALVVGVNRYSQLPDDAQLSGSINDATLIGTKLKSLGFNVTMLGDETATKQGVLNTLTRLASAVKPNERFVFYFAGHGSKAPDGKGVILPSDASPANQDNYITQSELYEKVSAIQARGRTIVLDSCFSGAMTRGLKGLGSKNRKSRFYNFFGLHQKKITLIGVNNADVPSVPTSDPSTPTDPAVTPVTPDPAAAGPICYFVAATNAQRAYEDEFDGKSDGVFTHFLATRLTATREQWSAVQSDVAGKVAESTEQTQSPILSQAYASVAVFEGAPKTATTTPPAPHRKVQTVWQTFNENHADPSQISLALTPNMSSIGIGEKFHFNVTVGAGQGYLVVMELDTDGNIDLLYPASRSADDCGTTGGMIKLPADPTLAYTVDKEGQERVRAILFRSKADAADLLSKFPPDNTIASVSDAQTRSIRLTSAAPEPFYTSSLDFEVISASKKAQLQNNTGE